MSIFRGAPKAEKAETPGGAVADRGNAPTLRCGDFIEIRLGGVPSDFVMEVTSQYSVDDQGNLSLPFIPAVKVAGLTISQAQAAIVSEYQKAEVYTHPTITITMQNTARFVSVGGAVRAPGRIPFSSDLTLMSAINAAGGPNEFAKDHPVTIIRNGKATSYDLRKLRKDPSLDPAVLPGDQINVPQSTGLF